MNKQEAEVLIQKVILLNLYPKVSDSECNLLFSGRVLYDCSYQMLNEKLIVFYFTFRFSRWY